MTTHQGNLLVVDDNEMNRDMLSRRHFYLSVSHVIYLQWPDLIQSS
jgi:hypothetical protein